MHHITFLWLLLLVLTACSPKESQTQNTTPPPPPRTTGLFVDSPVANLHYTCSSNESNITTKNGEFTCLSDANISFSIGGVQLGERVPVQEIITPVTLFKNSPAAALHLMQLLQTLDTDANPDNGIEINMTLASKLTDLNISFDDANSSTLITQALNIEMVSSSSAYAHYEKTQQTLNTQKLDVDYTPPKFLTNTTLKVDENQKNIITLSVYDRNSVTFTLSDPATKEKLFTLNPTTGELSFNFLPDYETKNHYSVEITADDGVNISTQKFFIDIVDIDENPPIINTPEHITISENETFVTEINATDESPLTYSIEGKDKNFFTIDAQTGRLTFTYPADYETQKEYEIVLVAADPFQATSKPLKISLLDIPERDIPTLVIFLNWLDYSQYDTSTWYNKIFSKTEKSVARWYQKVSDGKVNLYPVHETYGTTDDGIIIVNISESHPGSADEANFRDTYLREAITSTNVIDNLDVAALDVNHDKQISRNELAVIFIVAGGETSYGDNPAHSVWAHSWFFESDSAPVINGIELLKYTGVAEESGSYVILGAKQGNHLATIGIIAHELGHAIYNLLDYYDDGGGSGLGWYDIMSSGSWARTSSDDFAGATPTEFTIFNKNEASFPTSIEENNASQTVEIQCSSLQGVKLKTKYSHEYFLIECRDTTQTNSDISFTTLSTQFNDRLFTLLYHVDDAKDSAGDFLHNNTESGTQTSSHHYSLALVEKETTTLMTNTEGIYGDFADVYLEGDTIETSATTLYNGEKSGYKIKIISENYEKRSVTVQITLE